MNLHLLNPQDNMIFESKECHITMCNIFNLDHLNYQHCMLVLCTDFKCLCVKNKYLIIQ